jgi:hypothetical protein
MASQREVRGLIASVMLVGHNVFDMKRDDIVVLMDAAIFTAVYRPNSYKRSGLCVHL